MCCVHVFVIRYAIGTEAILYTLQVFYQQSPNVVVRIPLPYPLSPVTCSRSLRTSSTLNPVA